MNLSINVSVPVITVFVQGILSFFSPCVLPLLPLYMGYLAGGTIKKEEDGTTHYDRKKVMLNTFFFVLGVSFAFFLLGLGMSAIGKFFSGNQYLFARIGGVIIVVFGLYQLGLFGKVAMFNKERRLPLHLDKMTMSPWTALIMGFVLSFAWTPCVGPTLSSVLLMAASASSQATGFALIGVYTLGYVIPFLLVGVFTTSLLEFFGKHRSVVKYTVKIGGALMILMGFLMITGKMNSITSYLSSITPGSRSEVTEEAVEEQVAVEESTDLQVTDEEVTDQQVTDEQTVEAQATEAQEEQEPIPAPDFTLIDQFGNSHTLSDYRGKIVFLNFWATWCPPCRAEMPDIQALYEEYQQMEDPDVVILGVAFPEYGDEQDVEGVTAFLKENGYTYPTVMDTEADLILKYYITAYPTTFMIDPDGNVLGYIPGSMTREIMEDVIAQSKELSGIN